MLARAPRSQDEDSTAKDMDMRQGNVGPHKTSLYFRIEPTGSNPVGHEPPGIPEPILAPKMH